MQDQQLWSASKRAALVVVAVVMWTCIGLSLGFVAAPVWADLWHIPCRAAHGGVADYRRRPALRHVPPWQRRHRAAARKLLDLPDRNQEDSNLRPRWSRPL